MNLLIINQHNTHTLFLYLMFCCDSPGYYVGCLSLWPFFFLSSTSFCCPSQATDADLFSNVTYRIRTEAARQLFSLNPITGELAVLQTLDFEDLAALGIGTSYSFQVEAVDQGGLMPPGQATVTVRITVGVPGYPISTPLFSCHPSLVVNAGLLFAVVY